MIVEIKGNGSHNKGAEMMLLTILQELRDNRIKFAVAPCKGICEYPFYSKLGLYPKFWFRVKGIQLGLLGRYIPTKLKDMYGIVSDDEVNVVLDASGFAYSSQWGDYPAKIMAAESKRWKKKGKKIILMPQAFGPFETREIKIFMKQVIDYVDLIYARDGFSYKELLNIVNDTEKIKQCPDFTVLFKGIVPDYFNPEIHQICIVPNQRMKDKRSDALDYEEFFVRIISYLQSKNLSPFFLIYGGGEDKALADKINGLLDKQIEIIPEEDPRLIKGIIQESLGLIGSRFHSLASALFSATPALGTGWSHKYKYLFDEFDFTEGLIDLSSSDDEIENKLQILIDEVKRAEFVRGLKGKKKSFEDKAFVMFEEVKKEIGLK